MNQVVILCVEDEPEVRDALVRDLAPFSEALRIEAAEDVEDARGVVAECGRDGDRLGLVLCDHVLPGAAGVDFLVELNAAPETAPARKVLVTGQAGLEDTIKAVNEASLDHYLAKPWSVDDLRTVVRRLLTDFAIEQVEDLLPLVQVLDGERLLEALRERAAGD